MYTIFCDGASRNNPGESGVGIVISKNGEIISQVNEYIGKFTNNIAEYISVIRAIYEIIEISKNDKQILTSKIILAMDSQLVVKQLNKEFKIKQPQLQYLSDIVFNLIKENQITISIIWVPRNENTTADELANIGIDKKIAASNVIHSIIENLNNKTPIQKDNQNLKENNNNNTLNQILIAERVFFSKTTCLKFQISKRKEVYFHIGALKQNQWNWKIVKFNDIELSELLFILEGKKDKCAFFHSNSHNNANTKTQIWCANNEKGFSIKIQEHSKLLSPPEARILQELIKNAIWEINKL